MRMTESSINAGNDDLNGNSDVNFDDDVEIDYKNQHKYIMTVE